MKVECVPKKQISIINPKVVMVCNGENISSALKSKIVQILFIFPVEDNLLFGQNADDFETVVMTTNRNEQYHCSLPKSDAKATLVKKIEN